MAWILKSAPISAANSCHSVTSRLCLCAPKVDVCPCPFFKYTSKLYFASGRGLGAGGIRLAGAGRIRLHSQPVGILSLGCKTGQLQTILLSTNGTDDDDAAPRFCCFQTAPPSEIHLCSSLFSLAAQAVPGLNRPIPYSPGDVKHGFLWTTSSIDRTSDLSTAISVLQ
jgi:hypothetical protein